MEIAPNGGLVLESEWHPSSGGNAPRYRLVLTNSGPHPIADFRLAFSGPARVSSTQQLAGARIVRQLSNYCEIAPDPGFTLTSGESWTIDIENLDYPIRHWTDGAAGSFVILADGATLPVLTIPTTNAAEPGPRRGGTMALPLPDEGSSGFSIIPWPAHVDATGRRTPPEGLDVRSGQPPAAAFEQLCEMLFPGEGVVRPAEEGGFVVHLDLRDGQPPEGYEIAFSRDSARVAAATQKGLLFGLVTLGQIQRGARLHPRQFAFPTAGRIVDAPRMRWRGCHLDVARRFYGAEEVAQFLAILAWNKLNVFHWHLSDDEAWRVEIDAFPELTEVGAWRGHGLPIPPLLGSGPEPSGGFYSKDTVRNLVSLAHTIGIEIVPEIDVPGHCFALLEALPRLRDPDETEVYHSIQSFPNNCLNPAVEGVYEALETIFSELIELFPSHHFHIGADEVPAEAWSYSPAAEGLAASMEATGAAPMQAHFLRRLQGFLSSRNKLTGAWEEAAQGGGIDRERCYLVGWHSVEASRRLAAAGYNVVVSPGQAYYLDMALSENWHECGAGWAGSSSPQKTYKFEPAAGWSEHERARLMGVQACIWSEPMADRGVFDRLVFPRLSAIAETGWTPADRRDWTRFERIAGLMPNLYRTYERGASIG